MLRLHRYILALVLWISFLFNIERLDVNSTEVVNIASPVYGVAVVLVILGLLLPQWTRSQRWHLQTIAVVSFIIVKLSDDRPVWGAEYTYLSSFELAALLITATLAHMVGQISADFVETVRGIIFADMADHVYSREEAELRIKREMQDSRRAGLPLSVIVIDVEMEEDAQSLLHATAHEIQQLLAKRHSLVALTRLLVWRIRRTDFIVYQNHGGRLVLIAPRAGRNATSTIIHRLNEQAKQHRDVILHCGVASFPDEGLTFDALVRQAEQNLQPLVPERRGKATVDRREVATSSTWSLP